MLTLTHSKLKLSPNLQLIYVSDIKRSTAFYSTIFNAEPVFSSPRYVAFTAGKEAIFAIWSGGTKPDNTVPRFQKWVLCCPLAKRLINFLRNGNKIPILIFSRNPTLMFLAALFS